MTPPSIPLEIQVDADTIAAELGLVPERDFRLRVVNIPTMKRWAFGLLHDLTDWTPFGGADWATGTSPPIDVYVLELLSRRPRVAVLAHELTHVLQGLSHGAGFMDRVLAERDEYGYWNAPHEVEARANERAIAARLLGEPEQSDEYWLAAQTFDVGPDSGLWGEEAPDELSIDRYPADLAGWKLLISELERTTQEA